jgi:predicted acyl esterase
MQLGVLSPPTVFVLVNTAGRTLQDISEHDLASVYQTLPLRDMDEKLVGISKAWKDWVDHPTLEHYWKQQAFQERMLGATVPVYHVTGGTTTCSTARWRTTSRWPRARRDMAERERQWLLIGPWGHGVNRFDERMGAIDFGTDAVIRPQRPATSVVRSLAQGHRQRHRARAAREAVHDGREPVAYRARVPDGPHRRHEVLPA